MNNALILNSARSNSSFDNALWQINSDVYTESARAARSRNHCVSRHCGKKFVCGQGLACRNGVEMRGERVFCACGNTPPVGGVVPHARNNPAFSTGLRTHESKKRNQTHNLQIINYKQKPTPGERGRHLVAGSLGSPSAATLRPRYLRDADWRGWVLFLEILENRLTIELLCGICSL